MIPDFSNELHTRIKDFFGRYETRRSAILPILHAIQDEAGWIRDEHLLMLERQYSLPLVDTREVLTFYTMYRNEPCKPYRFEVCRSISCWLMGSEKTLAALRQRMAQWKGETGEEPPFEVCEVECLGLCGCGPVAFVNKERHLRVTPEVALGLVEEYARKRASKEGV
jgi:NADH:ubiquinone oxidoreductase subunit E